MLRNNVDAHRCSYFELGLPEVVTVVLFCFVLFFGGGAGGVRVVVLFFLSISKKLSLDLVF